MSESMGDKTRVSGTDSIEESDNVWEITDTAETGQSNQAGILENISLNKSSWSSHLYLVSATRLVAATGQNKVRRG